MRINFNEKDRGVAQEVLRDRKRLIKMVCIVFVIILLISPYSGRTVDALIRHMSYWNAVLYNSVGLLSVVLALWYFTIWKIKVDIKKGVKVSGEAVIERIYKKKLKLLLSESKKSIKLDIWSLSVDNLKVGDLIKVTYLPESKIILEVGG